jgi:hypothetical protein
LLHLKHSEPLHRRYASQKPTLKKWAFLFAY